MVLSTRTIFALCTAILVLSMASLACAQEFTVVTNIVPPIKYAENGEPKGVVADVLKEITSRTKHTVNKTAKVLPLQHALTEVQNTPGTLLLALVKTPQRNPNYKWVGPVYQTRVGLIANKSRNIQVAHLAEAKEYTIGTILNSGPERTLLKLGFPAEKMLRCSGTEEIIQAIKDQTVDMIAFAVTPSFHIMLKAGINPKDYELLKEINTLDVYMAFNKETSDEIIAELQIKLDEIKKPGPNGNSVHETIVNKYFFPGI